GRASKRQRREAKLAGRAAEAAPPPPAKPLAKPAFGPATAWAQLWSRTGLDMGQVFKSPAYFVLLALAALLSLANLWLSTDISTLYGGRTYPVTRVMIGALAGTFSALVLIIAIYYA